MLGMIERTSKTGSYSTLRSICLALAALALTACSSVPQNIGPSAQRAAELAARGEHSAAAREYDALSAGRGAEANEYRLLATEQWLSASDAGNAELSLRSLVGPLESTRLFARDLLAIEIGVLQGAFAASWQALRNLPAPKGDAQTERLHALRQRIAITIGEPIEAIRSSRQRESLARDSRQVAALRAELLTQLSAAVAAGARFDAKLAGRDRIARGWLEAAELAAVSQRQSREVAAETTSTWRRRYPGHPASAVLASTYRDAPSEPAPARVSVSSPSLMATPRTDASALPANAHVAALLPLSGRNGSLGTQIREGLLSGFYQNAESQRISLRFYDTEREPLIEIVRRATRDGAVMMIGPLLKSDVAEMARLQPTVPVLALNALPDENTASAAASSSTPVFVQFALSPEDEARDIARRALAEGRTRAVALVPAGDWGTRVLAAFRQELQRGGGTLLAEERIPASDPSARDLTTAVQGAMRIGQSAARHRQLQADLNTPLAFQPRRRGDVDFLFVPANATLIRQIRPQLRFQAVADIPTYTLSDAWSGVPDEALAELILVDMPWMTPAQDAGQRDFKTRASQIFGESVLQSRLFALGHDAWLLSPALLRPGSLREPIAGLTGNLRVDASGQVTRRLRWVSLNDRGAPVETDSSNLTPHSKPDRRE